VVIRYLLHTGVLVLFVLGAVVNKFI